MRKKVTFRGVVLRRPPAVDVTAVRPTARTGGPVRVGREVAGRGGKAVSVITGLPLNAAELADLATRLKKLCGAGGAVKGTVIEIQGDHRDRLVAELQQLGYSARRAG
ncbi:MAG: stress response translation initiation inhibitor YciH [Sinobacteraceae bacterium]|nr:stress response translation initiation inhibitor YciH [Nevskiaceae bacterium]MBV8854756.1 stress response translation initiation inhibitor YciH [Nevskiaceae bacterium]MBV9911230.1 stress response translation initiation inhibitor YciH [Nevskiaceae bacterium]